jgi:hypothetical protein
VAWLLKGDEQQQDKGEKSQESPFRPLFGECFHDFPREKDPSYMTDRKQMG